jgi:hypothetical protein
VISASDLKAPRLSQTGKTKTHLSFPQAYRSFKKTANYCNIGFKGNNWFRLVQDGLVRAFVSVHAMFISCYMASLLDTGETYYVPQVGIACNQ